MKQRILLPFPDWLAKATAAGTQRQFKAIRVHLRSSVAGVSPRVIVD
ncbi:MAG TPA: hypothetical protein VFS12_03675 [Terriglobia bacterium]|nr:hypothetical protein [Terriglobia bacterium]